MLFEPPNVSGWDDGAGSTPRTFRARWRMAAEICNDARLDDGVRGKVPPTPAELVRRAAAFWDGTPLSRPTRTALERYAAARGDRDRGVEARVLPRADRERAAHADRRLPGLPDLMNRPTTPASAAPSTPAPAPACPRSSAACPTPAGTGLSRRSFLLRSAGLALSVTAPAGSPGCPSSRRASPAPRPAGRHRARQRVPRRRRRQPLDPGAGRRSRLPPAAPEPRGPRRRHRVQRGHADGLAPRGRAARRAARRGQGLRDARRRLRPARTSRTSSRATSGRSARPTRSCAPAGWAA